MCPVFSIIDPATQGQLSIKATVEFYPGDFLPEFVEVQNSIRQKLERQKMVIEAAADVLVDFFNQYEPKALKVKIEVTNNTIFFPVSVFAESGLLPGNEADVEEAAKKNGEPDEEKIEEDEVNDE
jgi:hypothetical protein